MGVTRDGVTFPSFFPFLFEEAESKIATSSANSLYSCSGKNSLHSNALQKIQLVTLVFSVFLVHIFSNTVSGDILNIKGTDSYLGLLQLSQVLLKENLTSPFPLHPNSIPSACPRFFVLKWHVSAFKIEGCAARVGLQL